MYFLIIGCSLFVFGISLLIAWLRIFKIFTNLFFLGFLLYRNMLISSIMDVYLSVSLCNSLRFLCFESTVIIYMFVIIIFLGSFLFFHYRRDRQTSLFLLVSYPFIEVKAFKGLNFIWNPFLSPVPWGSLLKDFKTIGKQHWCLLILFFLVPWWTSLSYFEFKYAFKRLYLIFYSALPAVVGEFLGYLFCSVVATGNFFV